jgi:hypothetical protein
MRSNPRQRYASAPCARAKATCRYAGDPEVCRCLSIRLFAALFELLLERGKLCEWRIRVRLLVAAVGATSEWLCVILLALRAVYALTTIAARAFAAGVFVSSLSALALLFHPLTPLVAVLPFLAVRPIAAFITRMTRPA